jgi:hypothetical protein
MSLRTSFACPWDPIFVPPGNYKAKSVIEKPKIKVKIEKFEKVKEKTETCKYWKSSKGCPWGDACKFAHGVSELRPRLRNRKFRTRVCIEPAHLDHLDCQYILEGENRCNYAHPGDAMRIEMTRDYYEAEYDKFLEIMETEFPKGIYL